MEAQQKVHDPTEPFTVALVALTGLIRSDGEEGEAPPDAEVYLNLYPATPEQFNAVLESCDKAGVDYGLDVVNGRVRVSCGPSPGAPVVMWHPNSTEADAA